MNTLHMKNIILKKFVILRHILTNNYYNIELKMSL